MEGIVYIAASQDGFIADAQGGVDWLEAFGGEDYGYAAFLADMDVLIMGRATYDQVRGFGDWPYPDKETIVLTSRPLEEAPEGCRAWHDSPGKLAKELWLRTGKCWIVGGARTIDAMLDAGMVHTIDLFEMPVVLGDGVPLWVTRPNLHRWGRFVLKEYASGARHIRYLAPPC
jgi:dihydrofolate reductase